MAYAVINVQGETIEAEDTPEDICKGDFTRITEIMVNSYDDEKEGGFPSLSDIERRAITKALSKAEGNVILAACLLGISKSTIYRKLKEYDIPY
jgi:transcriptional regulator of acetoin/glycerol metabolism